MNDYHVNIFFCAEDGGYVADIPDLIACSAYGQTPAEALEQLQIAHALRVCAFLASYRGASLKVEVVS
ncbi:MAG: type II toxin-antitoxin system HicB family antitoxin [Chloroflexi bacterium]|nr:type II toxin-antitoxin system HicB family antitoxin [Chloroflexota bacterium]